jgi:hypothetical protein
LSENFERALEVALHRPLQCLKRSLETVSAKRGEVDSKRCIESDGTLEARATPSRQSPSILMIVQSGHFHCLIAKSWLECLQETLLLVRDKHKLGNLRCERQMSWSRLPHVDHDSIAAH